MKQDPARLAVNGWIKSPGHRANMLSDLNLCAVAGAVNKDGIYYFTQLFAKAPILPDESSVNKMAEILVFGKAASKTGSSGNFIKANLALMFASVALLASTV